MSKFIYIQFYTWNTCFLFNYINYRKKLEYLSSVSSSSFSGVNTPSNSNINTACYCTKLTREFSGTSTNMFHIQLHKLESKNDFHSPNLQYGWILNAVYEYCKVTSLLETMLTVIFDTVNIVSCIQHCSSQRKLNCDIVLRLLISLQLWSQIFYLIGGDTTNIRSLYPVLGTVSPNDNRHGNAFYNTNRSRKASGESGLDFSSESLKHGCPMDWNRSTLKTLINNFFNFFYSPCIFFN